MGGPGSKDPRFFWIKGKHTHTGCQVFLSFVASLLSLLSLQIIFTGHSLGGALATLSSVDVAQTIRPGLRGVTDMENQWQTAVSLKCTMATMVYLFNLLTVYIFGHPTSLHISCVWV